MRTGAQAAIPVVPACRSCPQSRHDNEHIRGERSQDECSLNKITWCQRSIARFEKLTSHYLGFVSFVATLLL